MRGYFAIGAERISKELNLGNLVRSAHAFGASFFFTVGPPLGRGEAYADTSKAAGQLPIYSFPAPAALTLPKNCKLVGIELLDGAIDLPSFRHPLLAAYVLGPERGSLSDGLVARCDYIVKIPTAFAVNIAIAGAIVMYDRVRSLGRFPERPVGEGGPDGKSSRPWADGPDRLPRRAERSSKAKAAATRRREDE
jgi:tRNA G18 (ribose-2'-O)-methylase SpoU